MLVSIQQYANYHVPVDAPRQAHNDAKPLSVVYEVLQRWEKSLATFEALSSQRKDWHWLHQQNCRAMYGKEEGISRMGYWDMNIKVYYRRGDQTDR